MTASKHWWISASPSYICINLITEREYHLHLVLVAGEQFRQLLHALLGERELRNAEGNVAPLLEVVSASETVTELLQ